MRALLADELRRQRVHVDMIRAIHREADRNDIRDVLAAIRETLVVRVAAISLPQEESSAGQAATPSKASAVRTRVKNISARVWTVITGVSVLCVIIGAVPVVSSYWSSWHHHRPAAEHGAPQPHSSSPSAP